MNFPNCYLGTEWNPSLIHFLPAVFLMRGEYEHSGEPAGLMLGATWLGFTLSVCWC